MANECVNRFQLVTSDKEVLKKVTELVKEYSGEITFNSVTDGKHIIEGTFISNWNFPLEDFSEVLIDGETEHAVFKCLSEEPGMDYVAMNIFTPAYWWEEQTFDMPASYEV